MDFWAILFGANIKTHKSYDKNMEWVPNFETKLIHVKTQQLFFDGGQLHGRAVAVAGKARA